MTGGRADEPVPCLDPECAAAGGMAEPESDGELRYYACPACGYEGGYQMVRAGAGLCAAGLMEEDRRAVSVAPVQEQQPVFIGTIGRRPE